MLAEYIPVLVTFLVAGLVGLVMVLGSRLFGTRARGRIKMRPFECGNPPSGPARQRFPVKFYLVAIFFIAFDLEIVFMYPWAVIFRELGIFGLIEMFLFIAVLTLGLVYVWRKGALEWES